MEQIRQNYYGNLCTEMYEILHSEAPSDELDFYLSYAEKGKKILEPLCGSGRFLVPFLERGFTISGIDLSEEMLAKLKQKAQWLLSPAEISFSILLIDFLITSSYPPALYHFSLIFLYADSFLKK